MFCGIDEQHFERVARIVSIAMVRDHKVNGKWTVQMECSLDRIRRPKGWVRPLVRCARFEKIVREIADAYDPRMTRVMMDGFFRV